MNRRPKTKDRRPNTKSSGGKAGAGSRKKLPVRHELSAGGIVYRTDRSAETVTRYLLICDSYGNWGFPKGHVEPGEVPDAAALREVGEETGLTHIEIRGLVDTIEWFFRFRGRLIHKRCHFYLMESHEVRTKPQRAEGITECRWAPFGEAMKLLSYANAREVLDKANAQAATATNTQTISRAHSPA